MPSNMHLICDEIEREQKEVMFVSHKNWNPFWLHKNPKKLLNAACIY